MVYVFQGDPDSCIKSLEDGESPRSCWVIAMVPDQGIAERLAIDTREVHHVDIVDGK